MSFIIIYELEQEFILIMEGDKTSNWKLYQKGNEYIFSQIVKWVSKDPIMVKIIADNEELNKRLMPPFGFTMNEFSDFDSIVVELSEYINDSLFKQNNFNQSPLSLLQIEELSMPALANAINIYLNRQIENNLWNDLDNTIYALAQILEATFYIICQNKNISYPANIKLA